MRPISGLTIPTNFPIMGIMKLSSYMDEHGLDNATMASKIGGCSAGAVHKWRYGERIPRSRFIIRIREITDGQVTANDFVPSSANEEAA